MAHNLMNAAVSIEALRSVLGREGQQEAAHALRGMEFMDCQMAHFARDVLASTKVYGPLAEAAKEEALRALDVALKPSGKG